MIFRFLSLLCTFTEWHIRVHHYFFICNNKNLKKRLTSKSSQNEEAALEIYNLKLSIESYEGKLKASKSANAEQLTSFQEEIKGKEELIQELQSIIKGKIFFILFYFTMDRGDSMIS